MIIDDVDFAAMYRRHMQRSDRPAKPESEWDARAKSLSGKVMDATSRYTREFVSKMDLSDAVNLP